MMIILYWSTHFQHLFEDYILKIKQMQLLKLTNNFNTTGKNCSKPSNKNYYLNILQKCVHVPKDDRLLIRKYLSSLKSFDENNQIVAILNNHSKKGNQNTDKKLDVLLRKQADKIRRVQQNQMIMPKNQQIKSKCSPRHDHQVKDLRGHCNNFNFMMQSLRPISNTSNREKSHNKQIKRMDKSIDKKTNKQMWESMSCRKYKSLRQSKQKENKSFETLNWSLLKSKNFKYCSNVLSNKSSTNMKSESKMKNKTVQSEKQMEGIFKLDFNGSQPTGNLHKQSTSCSIQDLIRNFNKSEQDLNSLSNFQSFNLVKIDQQQGIVSSFDQQLANERYATQSLEQPSLQGSFSNLPISTINNFNQSISSFFSARKYNTGSVHSDLKEVRICSQELFDYLIPKESKQTRGPNDISIPYNQFIRKLNEFIKQRYGEKIDLVCANDTVYIPFHTQYDLVTFDKIVSFLQEYTYPQFLNNPTRDLFTRIQIGVCGLSHTILNHKRINMTEFRKSFEWKKQSICQKFQNLIKKCSTWGTCLTYWQMYWLKDTPQFLEFQAEFNAI